MTHRLRLAGVLSELDAEVQAIEPVDGFGLLLPDSNGQFTFLSRSPWGNNAYAFAAADLPAPFRVQLSEPAQFTPLSPGYDLGRPLDAMFARSGLERLTLAPLSSGLGTFWTATRSTGRLTDEQLHAHVALTRSIDTKVAAGESTRTAFAGFGGSTRWRTSCRRWPTRSTCVTCSAGSRRSSATCCRTTRSFC